MSSIDNYVEESVGWDIESLRSDVIVAARDIADPQVRALVEAIINDGCDHLLRKLGFKPAVSLEDEIAATMQLFKGG